MIIIDISWPISESMTGYKDRMSVHFEQLKTFSKDQVRSSRITLDSHTGTHIDAPAHFLSDGKTIDQIDRGIIIGECTVLDFMEVTDGVTKSDLEKKEIKEGDIVLLKTKNSSLGLDAAFDKNFIYLEKSGAQYLVEKKIKAVGIDYLGIERNQPDHETHTILMKHEIGIIEGLRLSHVEPQHYFFLCLSLPVVGLEAAPARAILVHQQ
ncbi:cyclase family protein [Candidatus Dependentiae bacterium]|nr:cyclase family protein [Candidatus Dependentiae bacterium]